MDIFESVRLEISLIILCWFGLTSIILYVSAVAIDYCSRQEVKTYNKTCNITVGGCISPQYWRE